ncbi:type VI secretion system tube protein TssD [uncultured Zobellia sp.]|uniref:type VI secretion system tube protein TssD n=1 Tax=uncultured Zobellia sp. TaxID=255433 RepID=UPI002599CE1D|nr:type VI secretion system tube protein TssD [uncultured Zobellia sp.]
MAFKAKLKVGGKEYNVLHCTYELHQDTDATGRPSSVTRGGTIEIITESTADTDFSDWMFNNFERKDGSIVFLKRDTDATSKELKFTEAYMVKYKENFDSIGGNPMSESFTLSAKTIGVGNGEHVNEWV